MYGPSYPTQQPYPTQQTILAQNVFDSGARFDGIAQQTIPVSRNIFKQNTIRAIIHHLHFPTDIVIPKIYRPIFNGDLSVLLLRHLVYRQ